MKLSEFLTQKYDFLKLVITQASKTSRQPSNYFLGVFFSLDIMKRVKYPFGEKSGTTINACTR